MNENLPTPEVQKVDDAPVDFTKDSREKTAVIDKAVTEGKGTPNEAAISQLGAKAKLDIKATAMNALRQRHGTQEKTFAKLHDLV